MNRRKYLAISGGMVALAGCSGETEESPSSSGGESDSDSQDGSDSSSGDGSDGGSESGDGEDSIPTHEIGDTFMVGGDENAVEYTVSSASTADAIGGEYSREEANGVFLIVQLEMVNQTSETINISSNHLKAVDSDGNQFDADAGASVYLESDGRFDVSGISFEQLNPGLSTSGAVIFDVATGSSYSLLVEPVGLFSSADSHLVELGST
ncbi:DUF4352 domain-containing protein [Halorubrum tropicale]|uniref:DUF4352 domain-containing protein n=1 Tax=Halorubrum tropicale TaxID=1765655 RepID=UPI0009E92BCC|nr:DUF4352 domain-containing protein [Halorubrum tropicale]